MKNINILISNPTETWLFPKCNLPLNSSHPPKNTIKLWFPGWNHLHTVNSAGTTVCVAGRVGEVLNYLQVAILACIFKKQLCRKQNKGEILPLIGNHHSRRWEPWEKRDRQKMARRGKKRVKLKKENQDYPGLITAHLQCWPFVACAQRHRKAGGNLDCGNVPVVCQSFSRCLFTPWRIDVTSVTTGFLLNLCCV